MECVWERAGQVIGVQGRMHRMLDPHEYNGYTARPVGYSQKEDKMPRRILL